MQQQEPRLPSKLGLPKYQRLENKNGEVSTKKKLSTQKKQKKKTIQDGTRIVEKDAVSRVSTEYTKDAMTTYSADYSSVAPYRLMRPKNLTLWKLLCSLELADCMPWGPYDYNVEYDEIFSVGDDEVPNDRWFRRRDTFNSGDSF
mmetsp:Transcript_39570/g.95663  ORF Transcript_39570/g.95663 Transcript_39570/m.95663 type:complete len:145 (+) Transcript_39570:471-905(+)